MSGKKIIRGLKEAIKHAGSASQPSREVDWRPIETAPKDGTPILAFGRAKGLTVMKWHQPGNPKANGFWTGGNHSVCPTHWMPLPEPPETQQ